MGTIIPFPQRQEDPNALVSQLQTSATTLATTLQTCVQVTVCFQSYDVSPTQCARAAAHLHHLVQQVQELYSLVESLSHRSANRYPVLIQAHYVVTLLEQTINVIQEVREQKGNLHKYLSAWREAHQQVRTYPAQVTDLVEKLAHYCRDIVRNARY